MQNQISIQARRERKHVYRIEKISGTYDKSTRQNCYDLKLKQIKEDEKSNH